MRSGFTDPSAYVLAAVAIVLAVRAAATRPRVASLALPLIAGWLVALFDSD